MPFEEWKRLNDRKAALNTIFTRAMPSDFTPDEWEEMYREYEQIAAQLYDPSDQSAQERKLSA